MSIKPYLLLPLCCLALSSCYFNSAGHIINAGSYTAKVKTDSLKPGQVVYQKGNHYYTELARYRNDKEVRTQYSAFDDNSRKMDCSYAGKQMCEIPAAYAQYITGQSGVSVSPNYLHPVDNGDEIMKTGTKLPIVRLGEHKEKVFEYRSSNLPWLWTAAAFDWLCVDLPITCVENAMLPVLGLMISYQAHKETSQYYNYTPSSYNSDAAAREQYNRDVMMQAQQLRDSGQMR